jgi:hypothetical protein
VTLPSALREGDEVMCEQDNAGKIQGICARDGMDSGDCSQNCSVTLSGPLREDSNVTSTLILHHVHHDKSVCYIFVWK